MRQRRFDAFLTTDQNVPFQQNVKASGIAVVVVAASTNRLKDLLPLVPRVLQVLAAIQPGQLERVNS